MVHHTLIQIPLAASVFHLEYSSCDVGRSLVGPRSLHYTALDIRTMMYLKDHRGEAGHP